MPNTKELKNMWHDSLLVFGRISGWVVGPVIASLFIGKFFDEKFNTTPYIFLSLTAFAFLISCYGIYRESARYLAQIEREHGKNTDDSTTNTP